MCVNGSHSARPMHHESPANPEGKESDSSRRGICGGRSDQLRLLNVNLCDGLLGQHRHDRGKLHICRLFLNGPEVPPPPHQTLIFCLLLNPRDAQNQRPSPSDDGGQGSDEVNEREDPPAQVSRRSKYQVPNELFIHPPNMQSGRLSRRGRRKFASDGLVTPSSDPFTYRR